MTANDSWKALPWFVLEQELFRLQKRIYQASLRNDYSIIRSLQKLLLSSRTAKLIAVRRVTQDNMGKRTAGIDGVCSVPPEHRLELADSLQLDGEAAPVRRIYIPKPGSEERRALGIPTMHDRALQALVKFALEPEWEARFEPNSYGFRPGRSCWDAVQAIFQCICQKDKYVLDADIAKCFDRIDQEALLGKVNASPAITRQLRAWLKAGILDGDTFLPSESGTPQGGVASPLLANIALHGLENLIGQRFPCRTVKGERLRAATLIRYADDLVVLHDKEEIVRQCQEVIAEWLKTMGLELKPSKTRIGHTFQDVGGRAGFDFLGFTIRQFPAGATRSSCNGRGYALGFVTLIRPSKEAIQRHIARLREILLDHAYAPQAALIRHLNPVIRGWSNYYSTMASSRTFQRLDHVLTRMLLRWAFRRHPQQARDPIVRKYWGVVQGQKWTFRCPQTPFRLYHHTDTKIVRHVKVQHARSPFDGDWIYWSTRWGRYPDVPPAVAKLLKRQKGRCRWCGWFFRHGDLWNIDHVTPTSQGGTDATNNLQLLHRHCHQQKHGKTSGGVDDSHQTTEEPDEVETLMSGSEAERKE